MIDLRTIDRDAWDRQKEQLRIELLKSGLPFRPCGLNADWSVSAWHLGPSARPNFNDGEFYAGFEQKPLLVSVRDVYRQELDRRRVRPRKGDL